MRDENDWRLQGQARYLTGVELGWQEYREFRAGWDHDHCEFCSAKFSENLADALRSGYTTPDRYRWICRECFDDFRDLFGWQVTVTAPE